MQIIWLSMLAIIFLYLERKNRHVGEPFPWIYCLFFFSGFPALIYQIVWERALFAIYGVNVESVAVVVTAFILGLGVGSIVGGQISRSSRISLLVCFAIAELSTGAFGIFSLKLFHQVAQHTVGASLLSAAILSFSLLLVPTTLMGSTLPFLVAQMVVRSRNVGQSVGLLYFVNTFGSAIACFVAGALTMRRLGQSGSVVLASTINILAGSGALVLYLAQRPQPDSSLAESSQTGSIPHHNQSPALLNFPIAMTTVAATGFIALAYEIIWYRLLSFESGSNTRVFAYLLSLYLFGIAIGGYLAHRLCSRPSFRGTHGYLRLIAAFVVCASCIGFFVPSLVALTAQHHVAVPLLLVISVDASLLAAAFPLICHVSLSGDATAGSGLGFLYFSNIVGATLGSFLVGIILMNVWGMRQLSVFLAVLGVSLGLVLLAASGSGRRRLVFALAAGALVCTGIVSLAHPLFADLYERLLYKSAFTGRHFEHLVENRSGVIAVSRNGTVYGVGAYDGAFNINLVHDVNGVFRPYFLSAFHPRPTEALMIGLSSGSWAQIVANHPQVKNQTVVEINPGYLQLIPRYPQVASLLGNPKVRIVIDDGRRWLSANPGRRFDLILMNTTFNWREHATNLLRSSFCRLLDGTYDRAAFGTTTRPALRKYC
jgi:predicted membrane-bound spermidine synthase